MTSSLSGKLRLQLGQRRDAAAVALDRDDRRPGVEQRAGQPARARADLIDALRLRALPGIAAIAREQLPVEDEILAERLACAEPVPRDDVAQRLGRGGSGGVGAQ